MNGIDVTKYVNKKRCRGYVSTTATEQPNQTKKKRLISSVYGYQ